MISYLLKRYFFIAILIGIVLSVTLFLAGIENFLLKGFMWSGFTSVYVTHLFFERQNLWVLYYNLQLPKALLLCISLVLFEIISICVLTGVV